ncbi:MAG: Elongation factor P [Parcubacteria group bacterium GW2011_GWA2_46_10]|nr:MAG: Elongation factor P [Parcubacteria group bacterium GW2011_GWA2_46_10]
MSLGINDVRKGSLIIMEGDPYLVMLVSHQHIGRGSANVQLKVKSLLTGKIFDRTIKSSESFEEAVFKTQDGGEGN